MYGGPLKVLSFSRIISGISKSLNLVSQIIPIYEKAKPLISNTKKAISSIKSVNIPPKMQVKSITNKSYAPSVNTDYNNPTFFK